MQINLSTAIVLVGLSGGCTPAGMISGAVATGGIAVAEERPIGTVADDFAIKLSVQKKLMDEEGLFPEISVEAIEGTVLLTGAVATQAQRIQATRVSWSVEGVREVINNVEISDPIGMAEYTRDLMLASRLKTRLVSDANIHSINYSIESAGRVLYIMGIAQNEFELKRVILHARDVSGVRRVINYARIKTPADQIIPANKTEDPPSTAWKTSSDDNVTASQGM